MKKKLNKDTFNKDTLNKDKLNADTFNKDMLSTDELQTDVGGVRALEMFYRGIREIETGSITFFKSRANLNTPGLGTLVPEAYRDVAEMSTQCLTLFDLEMTQILETQKKLSERDFFFRWISVYMPPKFLLERSAESKLVNRLEEAGVDTNRICFELSPKLLTEGTEKHARGISNLRNLGFHFMLTGFGGSNSPLMKLSEFPVDYVLLSQEITSYIGKSERSNAAVKSIVDFATGLGAEAIADGIKNAGQAEALYEAECNYICGPLAGKYTQERYIRKKNDNEKILKDKE
ncbi:EAL domain, c-di-GMP-specific phosphodiesterase class I (or its enzymatically inactive variant) [Lachnospiraceae bacterium RM5]|nr:EAL domain, c-di-GMP-specific phosphodiesterase class I (or its enzymatically inactive variant) [Lachnospiraceae bacterium RM5]